MGKSANLSNGNLEINKEIVFSTCHITRADDLLLDGLSKRDDNCIDSHEYGYRLLVSKSTIDNGLDFEGLSPFVCFLVGIALLNGCKWLLLDSDGPIIEALPVHEW
jgi:hypothetical protein